MSQSHILRSQALRFVTANAALAHAIADVVLEERMREDGKLVAGLTPGLRRVFELLADYEERHGFSPSYTEMCVGLAVGRSNLARMLGLLKERGYISFIVNRAALHHNLAGGSKGIAAIRAADAGAARRVDQDSGRDPASYPSRDRRSS